jgi:BirA family transcriptional regulator, biotin operon repressor / biotin---[acetyl-CoA-carboxylase] ligase
LSITWTLETHKTVTSTQDIVKGMAEIGHPEGMVVQAAEQTGGKGRHGRQWVSDKGNLYMSVLLRPSCQAQNIGQLSLLAGLATAKTIQSYLQKPEMLLLKWPNDVLINGEKCAGILLETSIAGKSVEWVALGIGINIKSAPPGMGTALKDHSDKTPKPEELREALLKNLNKYYGLWTREGIAAIRKQWLEISHKKGSVVKVRVGVQIESGNFYDVDEQGNLLLHDSDLRVKKVTAGEVYI